MPFHIRAKKRTVELLRMPFPAFKDKLDGITSVWFLERLQAMCEAHGKQIRAKFIGKHIENVKNDK